MEKFDIGFDENHDMYLNGSDIHFTNDIDDDVVKQRLTIRLQFLLSEWFLNNEVGLPYTQFIFEQGSDLQDIYNIFNNEIKNTDGVESVESLELTPNLSTKSLRVDFSVNQGQITDNIEVTT